ncbi:MAG: orotate phosphoribosyltransferase [Lachnospiraceae bacterium]|nr:orotate phosphoribosyltransferase [Lachnospiraceae bacterium]
MLEPVKIASKRYPDIELKVIEGHFVTPNSHISHYMDMTTMKTRQKSAANIARAMAENYNATTVVDTIICMDGTEVIGAYLAQELTNGGIISKNTHQTMYVVSPEKDVTGQLIFRENNVFMAKDKNVLLIMGSVTTGKFLTNTINSINYYGGTVVGVSAIFSAVTKYRDMPICAVFTSADVPDYCSYAPEECALCKKGVRVDGLANSYGYSRV